jgi:hypothetical protein
MSPGFEELYHSVARDYSQMWDFKLRGASLEIITPHSTISDKFVSVFLTQRGVDFIVSDGGYLSTGEYVENEAVQQSPCYRQTFAQLSKYYKVQSVLDSTSKLIFYTKTQRYDMVSAQVHDMASFITGVVNAQQITLEVDEEVLTRQRFAKQAGSFLLDVFPNQRVKFHQPLRVNDRVNFSAGIWRGSKVNLIQFVTGSTPSHFADSMTRATVNFLAVPGSSLAPIVNHKISFIDTLASGFRSNGNGTYASMLSGASEIFPWEERNRLVELLGSN